LKRRLRQMRFSVGASSLLVTSGSILRAARMALQSAEIYRTRRLKQAKRAHSRPLSSSSCNTFDHGLWMWEGRTSLPWCNLLVLEECRVYDTDTDRQTCTDRTRWAITHDGKPRGSRIYYLHVWHIIVWFILQDLLAQ
jgi:hypothetical protein